MAENRRDVVVRFLAQTGQLDKGADAVKGKLTGVATSLEGIAKLGGVVAGISFFKVAIDEAREAERVTRKTEQVLKSTGGQAKVSADHVGELATSMSNLAGVDDEVIQQGANVLLTFTKVRNELGAGNDIFDQATKVSLDMAAALDKTGDSGASMQENVIRIGKALNDPIKGMAALTKIGVTFTAAQKDQITALVESGNSLEAQKVILRELQTEFGGMAKASADSVSKAEVSWKNFAEAVGMRVMPAVNAISDWALHTGIPVLGRVADTVGNVVEPAFRGLVSTGRDVVSFWQGLPGPIQAGAIALGAWQLIGDRVTGTFGRMGGGVKGLGDDVKTAMGAFDVGRVQGTMMVLEERIPALGKMGQAFRDASGAGLALSNTMPGLQGGMLQLGSVAKGAAAAGLSGLRSAAGGLVSFLGGPWGLAFAGAAVVVGLWASRNDQAKKAAADHAARVETLTQAIIANKGAISDSIKSDQIAKAQKEGLYDVAKRLGISQKTMTDALLGNRTAAKQVNDAFQGLGVGMSGIEGSTKGVMGAFSGFKGETGIGGVSNAAVQARQQFSGMSHDMAEAGDAARGVAAKLAETSHEAQQYATVGSTAVTSTDLFAAAMDSAGIEVEGGAVSVKNLRDAIEALTTAQTMQMDTMEGYEASLDNLDAAVLANGKTLDIQTEAGRNVRDALEDAAAKSRDLMLSDIEAGVPMDEALARHNARIAALKNEATETFGANSEANTLIDTYSRVPEAVTTAITTQGAEEAQAAMDKLSAGQFLLANAMPMTPANVRAVLNERNSRYASGGQVTGPGSATSDDVLAWLSNGEFVQKAAAVQYYGPGFMSALNDRRIPKQALPGYADGGMVWPIKVDLSKTKIPDPVEAAIAAAGSVGSGGAGVQRWAPLVLQVLQMLGQSAALLPNVLRRMNQESGGNPTAANLWDSNAKRGTPSMGLMQTILPTFNAYAGPFLGRGIMDPLANIYAGLNYAIHRYPSLQYAMDKPGGYDNGGWLGPGQSGVNKLREPEAVLTPEESSAHKSLAKSAAAGKFGTPVEKHYHLTMQVRNHAVDVATQFARMEMMEGL